MNDSLDILYRLMQMSKIELISAKMATDNETIRRVIQSVIDIK